MGLNIYVKNILLFILDYLYFVKNEIFASEQKSINNPKDIEINLSKGKRRIDGYEVLDGGEPLKTYENDYNRQGLTTEESQV